MSRFGVRCGVPETTCLAWVCRGKYRGVVLCGPFLADELDDRRNQLGRHDHDGLALGEKGRFVLGDLFVFGLIVVVLGKLANSLFIPSRGIRLFSSLGHFFLRGDAMIENVRQTSFWIDPEAQLHSLVLSA